MKTSVADSPAAASGNSEVVPTGSSPATETIARVDTAVPAGEVAEVAKEPTTEAADLSPRIAAMKAFLARYPSRRAVDEPEASPPAAPTADAAEASPADDAHASDALATQQFHPELESDIEDQNESQIEDQKPVVAAAPSRRHLQERRSAVPVLLAWPHRWRIIAAAAVVVLVAALTIIGLQFLPSAAAEETGTLTVDTNPSGVPIFVDGTARGATPMTANLPPGNHVIEIVAGAERRRIPVTITTGAQITQFLELPRGGGSAPGVGELQVRTDPASAVVRVDGRLVGRSPMSVELTPGAHTVVLEHESGTVTERVLVESGRTASLVVTMGAPRNAASGGWIAVSAPTDVQILENDRLLGNSRMDRIMLPVGRHDLEFTNEALGYTELRSVQVSAGQVSTVRLAWPQGSLAVNAIPWAEVWIDGQRIGETPIGNVAVPVGSHEILFRHPELGERRSTVTVVVGQPSKIGVDLRSK